CYMIAGTKPEYGEMHLALFARHGASPRALHLRWIAQASGRPRRAIKGRPDPPHVVDAKPELCASAMKPQSSQRQERVLLGHGHRELAVSTVPMFPPCRSG